jgi:hypothetical protein
MFKCLCLNFECLWMFKLFWMYECCVSRQWALGWTLSVFECLSVFEFMNVKCLGMSVWMFKCLGFKGLGVFEIYVYVVSPFDAFESLNVYASWVWTVDSQGPPLNLPSQFILHSS